MLETEILVIGGGPAGSTLARALTQAGKHVVIMDKALFPRDKICAGWVTPAVMLELEINPDDYARDHVLQPIHGFRTGQTGQNQLQSDFTGEPVSYGIRRIEFDNYLLKRSGAELLQGQALKSMHLRDNSWLVNNAIRAELVIGAGGHFCPVARLIGSKKPLETTVVAQEIEFKMTPQQQANCQVDGERPELFFTADLKGYGWVFRKGEHLNIGLGREDKHQLSGHVDAFCEHLKQIGRIPNELPGKLMGHAYLLYHHAQRTMVKDRVMLIGDAAGLAYPQSGEGIRPAVESALLAAQTILECRGNYSASQLRAYVDKVERQFGRRKPLEEKSASSSPRFRQALARLLMRSPWFSKNFLIKRWFLRTQSKPVLATLTPVI